MVRLTFALLLTLSSSALAYKLKHDSTGTMVRWDRNIEFLADSKLGHLLGNPRALEAIQAAVAAVDQATPGIRVSFAEGKTTGVGYDMAAGSRNRNEIVAPEEWAFDQSSIAVAVLTIDSRTHRILDADIAFNRIHRRFNVLDKHEPGVGEYDDIQNAATHELGHTLGLAHNDEDLNVVMYPGARRGEINKRTLTDDDRAALMELYSEAVASGVLEEGALEAAGCSTSPSATPLSSAWVLLVALVLRGRKAKATAARIAGSLAYLSAGLAWAAPIRSGEAQIQSATVVVTAEVVSTRTQKPRPGASLLMTEVQLTVRNCLKGQCPEKMVVLVPGGRQGDIEQVIEGYEVPRTGAVLGVLVQGSNGSQTPTLRQTATYRLDVLQDYAAFATGLHTAKIQATLSLPRPATPSR